jgi:valyl-tRNA synthetase
MKDRYDYKETEQRIAKFWEDAGVYKFNGSSKKKVYAIDTPPPTVSGEMHMGHAFSYSQEDFIARYRRMAGFNVFYPFGTDDNGLPTARLVEKRKNVRESDMPRSEFIKMCISFLDEELPKFVQDWKRLGISCDFDAYYSTIDDHSRRISQWSFLDLYGKNRIYRKDAPSMWCPECKTGVAQIELKDKEIESTFNEIIFDVDGEKIVIGTTRPEMLPACVAVFYNPSDGRYSKYKGKSATVPLFGDRVTIIEDERAKPDFGTGLVMCCTFGDQTDMEWQKAHNLPIKTAISKTGEMTELAGKYKGMKIKSARKAILEELKAQGLLKSQKPIKHMVNVHERCGTEIEIIKSKQWFVRYLDLKKDMLKWGNEIKWHPDYMKVRYENWVNGLQWDWLISNQRYFGVQFPIWYCKKCGEIVLAEEDQLPVDPLKDTPKTSCRKCGSSEFSPETDTLNTWFTSSLTPQIAVQLMPKNLQAELFPMSLRPQGHDIITFWLFTTVLKSHLHFGKSPWSDTVISGFVTLHGEKMSKSKGNIIRPQDVMDKFGADAIRYWAGSSKLGEDLEYQEKDVATGARIANKMWNVAKLVNGINEKYPKYEKTASNPVDRWILGKAGIAAKKAAEYFSEYNYSAAKRIIDEFFWSFADNYLEFIKYRVYNNDGTPLFALNCVFLSILKMYAPFMPYITEEIYQEVYAAAEGIKSIHMSEWPAINEIHANSADIEAGDRLQKIIAFIRQWKHDNKMALNAEINEVTIDADVKGIDDIKGAIRIKRINIGKGAMEIPETGIKITIAGN